ncbi:hypothetical protein ACVWZA_002497 [Sphingomonas sp. UYAg733]
MKSHSSSPARGGGPAKLVEGAGRQRHACGYPPPPRAEEARGPPPRTGEERKGITLIPARPTHIGPIAHRLREHDRIECAALGQTPKQALRAGLAASSFCLTVLIDGRAEAMFGLVVTNALCGEGRPWMLGTDAVYRHPREMLRRGPRAIDAMLDSTPRLSNLVTCGNSRAIRFLRWLGFVIEQEVIVHTGTEFVTFMLERR